MSPITRSTSKRKRSDSMGTDDSTLLNDLVSLPIIISDYDAINSNKRRASEATTGEDSRSACITTATDDAVSSTASHQKWNTGFSDFADDLWSRMTTGMKQKLREACVEVLKRTDDNTHEESTSWQFDDDARLLD